MLMATFAIVTYGGAHGRAVGPAVGADADADADEAPPFIPSLPSNKQLRSSPRSRGWLSPKAAVVVHPSYVVSASEPPEAPPGPLPALAWPDPSSAVEPPHA